MILKESDLRHLVREVLTENEDFMKSLTKGYVDFSEKNPGASLVDFKKHINDLMKKQLGNKDRDDFSRSVELEDEEEEYRYWRSDLKSYFKGKPWVRVSLEEVEPTLDFFDERREDTSYYRRDIERAGYAWMRFEGASVKDGKRCAVFVVRIYGARGQYSAPKHGGNVRLYHYIDIEELGNKIKYLKDNPVKLGLEEDGNILSLDTTNDYVWKEDVKNFFGGVSRKWVKVALIEIKPTLDRLESVGIDTSKYIRDIRRAKFAWVRFSSPVEISGERYAAFEVRTDGFVYDRPKQLHYIRVEELKNKVKHMFSFDDSVERVREVLSSLER